jgi:hypothetical protein
MKRELGLLPINYRHLFGLLINKVPEVD